MRCCCIVNIVLREGNRRVWTGHVLEAAFFFCHFSWTKTYVWILTKTEKQHCQLVPVWTFDVSDVMESLSPLAYVRMLHISNSVRTRQCPVGVGMSVCIVCFWYTTCIQHSLYMDLEDGLWALPILQIYTVSIKGKHQLSTWSPETLSDYCQFVVL